MELRPYQHEAVASVEAEFARGIRSTLIVLATGCGKTIVFSHLAAREVRRGGRVLILAHRGELLTQAIDKLRAATGIEAGLEKAEETSDVAVDEIPYTVVVGSVQSMKSQKRLARFAHDEFSLVIIDECHHALTGTYRAVIDHFPKARLLGVTATPDRGDLRSLSEVFETIAYEYSIVDAIRGGYLSPIFVQTVPLKIDLSGVAVQSGDFQAASIGSALDPYLRQICREIKERCHDRKTIVFTPLIATSKKILEIFGEEGVSSVKEVNGESADRQETLAWFAGAPKGCVLLNSMLLCLDANTEILTDRGWVGMDGMTMQHKVANWNFDGTVFFEEPKEIVRRPLEKGREFMVSAKSPRCDIRVTSTHRMIVACGENGLKWKKIPAAELRQWNTIPTCGMAKPFDMMVPQEARHFDKFRLSKYAYNIRRSNPALSLEESKRIAAERIKHRESMRYKNPVELTLDECSFIGFWIADGSVNRLAKGGVEYTLAQSFAYPKIIDWIDSLLSRIGFDFKRRVKRQDKKSKNKSVLWSLPRGTGWGCQKRNGVYAIEPYLEKNGTDLLWGLNAEQFSALVEGFWYGDGNHLDANTGFTKSVYANNTNKHLIDLLSAIGSVRGWRCRVSAIPQKNHKHKTQYGIHMAKGASKFTFTRKTSIVHEPFKDENVWCVRTTSKNIITRRNGRIAIMGNTEGYDEPSCDCIVVLRATKVRALFVQMVGRGTRLCDGKQNLLLLDFLWLTASHDLCRPACLLTDDAEVCETITKKQESKGGADDLDLSPETLEEAITDTVKKREDALAKRLAAQSRKKGKLFDALQFAQLTGVTDLSNTPTAIQESDRPTMEIVDRLERLGFACPGSQTAAEKLLTAYQQRVDSGLSSHKQIKFLTSRGFRNVAQWPFAAAKKMIDRIAAVGWTRLPYGIDPETYAP